MSNPVDRRFLSPSRDHKYDRIVREEGELQNPFGVRVRRNANTEQVVGWTFIGAFSIGIISIILISGMTSEPPIIELLADTVRMIRNVFFS